MNPTPPTIARICMLALSSASLTGCMAFSHESSYESGTRVSNETVEQIQLGKTRWHFLQAAFGTPTSRRTVEGIPNYEIWTYSYERVKSSSVTVLFVFDGNASERERHTAYFELTDWVITKAWVE